MLQEANIIESSLKILNSKHVENNEITDSIESNDDAIEADLDFRFDETINIGFGTDSRFSNDLKPKK